MKQIQPMPYGERTIKLGNGPAAAELHSFAFVTWQGTHLQYPLLASCSRQAGTELQTVQRAGEGPSPPLLPIEGSPGLVSLALAVMEPQRKVHC